MKRTLSTFLLALDHLIPHLHMGSQQAEGPASRLQRTAQPVHRICGNRADDHPRN